MNTNKIYVLSFTGEELAIEFDPNDTVEELKAKIEAAEGTPVTDQYPVYDGELLQDGHTIW